ncbi:MAG TPA: hypothetical protein VGO28_09165 [Acidimicrobiia bacterium]
MKKLLVAALTVTAAIAVAFDRDAGAVRTGAGDRVVVRGNATLDGAPFDAQYLGAVVKRQGLVTPCQRKLPPVRNGRFTIPVFARSEANGCGAPGSQIFVWTFVQDQIVYSNQSLRWPGNAKTARFDPTFSTSAPNGGVGPIVGFAGEIFDGSNRRLAPGAHVEAFIGGTRCAVATTRITDYFVGFSIDVVGPDSIPGCATGATITFRVNGRDAHETAVNQLGQGSSLNLTPP